MGEKQNRIRLLFGKLVNRETVAYGIFGVLTTLVNLGVYRGLLALRVAYTVSNLVALIASKLFAYAVNKKYVFRSRTASFAEFAGEFLRFVAARGATALVDYFGLILLVERFSMDNRYAKYLVTALVIILNYILGKKMVFKAKEQSGVTEGKDGVTVAQTATPTVETEGVQTDEE